MPTLITEDFESYAVPPWDDNPLGAVWNVSVGPDAVQVEAGVGRSGSQGAATTEAGVIWKTLNPDGGIVPYFDITAWSLKSTSSTPVRGLNISLSNLNLAGWFVGFTNTDSAGAFPSAPSDDYLKLWNNYTGETVLVPGVYQLDVYQKFRFVGRLSTPNAAGTDLNTNGCLSVYVDDVLVASLTSIKVAVHNSWLGSPGAPNVWTDAHFYLGRYLDDVTVLNDPVTCPSTATTPPGNPLPNSPPCCHDGGGGGGGGGTQPPGHPGPILPPVGSGWTPSCTGGGTVPTVADVVDAETWAM